MEQALTEPQVAQAFDHPEARLLSDAGAVPPDRLVVRDFVTAADIGAFQSERGAAQRLRFNIAVEILSHGGGSSDDVDTILSYDLLTGAVTHELQAERVDLLETLAERIAARILSEPQAQRVYLRIEKLDRGPAALGVEIVRDRLGAGATAAPAPRPAVCYIHQPDLAIPMLVDRLIATGAPPVLVAPPPGLPVPAAVSDMVRLRIGLLAIEQSAWAIADRDPRLSVVGTRTEMDWAAREGRPIVWAPSKMVLDSRGAPVSAADGLALALWLAEERDAVAVHVHGSVTVPAASRVPVLRF